MDDKKFSRRWFLKGSSAAAGALALAGMPGRGLFRSAFAAAGDEVPTVFLVYLRGGYNALFASADSFLAAGSFGVADDNVLRVGATDLFVDKGSLGQLPGPALSHMASIGVRHGLSSHPAAQAALWTDGNRSYPVRLARALGGGPALSCVALGAAPPGVHRAEGGVSLQVVRDLRTTIASLGGVTSGDVPARELAAAGLAASQAMSAGALAASPVSGAGLADAYPAAIGTLSQPGQVFDYAEMATAYGLTPAASGDLPTTINGNNFRMVALGAELMVRAGARVVTSNIGGWDSHGDRDGSEVRGLMRTRGIVDGLRTFIERTQAMTDRNVVTVIFGDFSRSLPGSDHQANLTATVIGRHVKAGTTGKVSAKVQLPVGTPGIPGLWAYVNAVARSSEQPFGANPHALVL